MSPNHIRFVCHIMSGWWFQTFVIFHNIWVVILPIDELIFFKRVKTTNQLYMGAFSEYT